MGIKWGTDTMICRNHEEKIKKECQLFLLKTGHEKRLLQRGTEFSEPVMLRTKSYGHKLP